LGGLYLLGYKTNPLSGGSLGFNLYLRVFKKLVVAVTGFLV